jgi:hypothetical protein
MLDRSTELLDDTPYDDHEDTSSRVPAFLSMEMKIARSIVSLHRQDHSALLQSIFTSVPAKGMQAIQTTSPPEFDTPKDLGKFPEDLFESHSVIRLLVSTH